MSTDAWIYLVGHTWYLNDWGNLIDLSHSQKLNRSENSKNKQGESYLGALLSLNYSN